jgi:hemerythrin-like domain-containing protein
MERRDLLMAAAGFAAAAGCAGARPKEEEGRGEEEVSPAEDLMREHGILNRVLLVYDEGLRRIDAREELPPEAIAGGAAIIRRFIEDYHERLEEEFLFPRFERAGKELDLVRALRAQHQAGRRLTDEISGLATSASIRDEEGRRRLAHSLRLFIRMYRPHEAREDTILFPAFKGIVSASEYDALGEEFEDKEHALFGADGFERHVAAVAQLERTLGIHDLAQFTPG